ncbi:MAG TPA: Smr/MutS family protein [Candidatus Acidoferrales bacterium]|nr:Smr/MutS family protein [Candidatus Acidoferrales bacterium]
MAQGVDVSALQALEFPQVIDEVARFSTCGVGRTAVLSLAPRLGEVEWAKGQHALVEEVTGFFLAAGDLSFGGAIDAAPLLEQAKKGSSLSALELRQLAETERKIAVASRGLATRQQKTGPLAALARSRRNTDALASAIEAAVDEEGRVQDGASAKLAGIRRQHRELSERVRERCRAIVADAELGKLLSEPIVTVRSGRYVVPVRIEYAAKFPGVVLDQSASGATVFMEPLASVEANNRLRTLEADEAREISRILAELTARVVAEEEAVVQNGALLAALDSAASRARYGIAKQGAAPVLIAEPVIRIVRGRHPLLRKEAVPLDFEIGESFDAVVVSGPNMGGKTVVLKTVGLLVLLAFAGIPIPASATTTIGTLGRIACVIGDEQSIAQDLSSFSAHLRGLKAAAEGADRTTLVLVDEIGSGTEPGAGAALAQAFIESLIRQGSKVVVTTHFTQLKTFAAAHDRVSNASMLFDAKTNEPTYVFALGVPGQSLAFSLAHALALDPRVIARAEVLVGIDAQNLERTFERLAQERERMKQLQAELEAQQAKAQRAEQSLRQRIAAAEQERDAFERRASAELSKAVDDVRHALTEEARKRSENAARQAGKPQPGEERLLAQTLAEMRRSLGLEAGAAGEAPAARFAPGDEVYVKSFDQNGVVSEVYERDLLVTIGNLKTLVASRDLVKSPRNVGGAAVQGARVGGARQSAPSSRVRKESDADAQAAPSTSIDVRGMSVDEAWPLIDKALDDASLAGLSELRILHGKGTGRLARGIRSFLDEHPQVESATHPADREGGSGVTIVRLS